MYELCTTAEKTRAAGSVTNVDAGGQEFLTIAVFTAKRQPVHMYTERPRSGLWFLLPIFLGIVGGVISYFILRHDDPRKAKNTLYLGIVLTAIPIVMSLALGAQLGGFEGDVGLDVGI